MNRELHAARVRSILLIAIAMTTAAELFYLVLFGLILYPGGNLLAKTMWTVTCGLAMGSVTGAGMLLLAQGRPILRRRFWTATAIFSATGIYCAWLCGRIDMTFNYFGGAENPELFLLSGVVPAIAGGLLYAWIAYCSKSAVRAGVDIAATEAGRRLTRRWISPLTFHQEESLQVLS